MKWLFMTLIGLNLIVFAGMIAGKMWKEYKPTPVAATSQQAPVQVIINPNELAGATAASSVKTVAGSSATTTPNVIKPVVVPPKNDKQPVVKAEVKPSNNNEVRPVEKPQANYKNCSARVSMPEDDYHRIKGLLGKYPHAASRQVVEGSAEDGAQSSSRMNVLFMSVSDQDAGAIQAVVGRYGQLNRAPCNK